MHEFCNALLRATRADCHTLGIHIGKLSTIRHKSGNDAQFEIWQDSTNHGWISAHCAAEAKFLFLCGLIQKDREAKDVR
jgi:hypothetical protein